VKIVQRWNGIRSPINYLLRDYRTWLVSEKINERVENKRSRNYWNTYSNINFYNNSSTFISWIEKLLQISIADHRKYVIWRILIPYLFNIKNLSDTDVIDIVRNWLNKCDEMAALDFNADYLIRQNIRNSKRHRYLPISFNRLSSENHGLYEIISEG
jgi:Primase X